MDNDRIRELSEALAVAERRRQETQRLSGVGFWELNHKNGDLYWSEEIYAIYGLENNALSPDYGVFLTLIYDDDRDFVHQAYQDSVRDKTEYAIRYRIKAAGSVRWIEARGVTLYDDQGSAERSIGTAQDITEIITAQQQIEHLAYHDALTDLPNRQFFADRLNAAVQLARRDCTHVAVVFIDLDNFKQINDHQGHAVGDEVLVSVAHRLKSITGPQDFFARIGGDEFAGVLANVDTANIHIAVRRVQDAIEGIYVTLIGTFKITASIGVTLYPQDNAEPEVLLRHSDQAMYKAKESGKAKMCFFDTETGQHKVSRRDLLVEIATAIHNNEFVLYYQPKISLHDGTLVGAEALLRWFRGSQVYSPIEVKTAIQNTELEWELDNWVIRTVLAQSKHWHQCGVDSPVSVNINPHTVENQKFPLQLSALLTNAGVSGQLLELEILDAATIKHFEQAYDILQCCQMLGVRICLDDFGTEYSSLIHLHALPIDALKIDQRFIQQLNSDAKSLALVKSILAIAQTYHVNVIAEGIESDAIARVLQHLGCPCGQGYALAYPMPANDYFAWTQCWEPAQFQARLQDL